jgi:hypothetical protein
MGTRAVVHADLQPLSYGKDLWIATHWDGDPAFLGKELAIEIREEIRKGGIDYGGKNPDIGSSIQKAVGRVCANHHIDEYRFDRADFDKSYDDFAEFLYEVLPDGSVRFKRLDNSWLERKESVWKKIMADAKLERVL